MEEIEIHSEYMRYCIALGSIARQRGDSPVGALLIKDGKIVAEGIEAGKTRQDISCHAEIEAIRNYVKDTGITDLSGHTMYTTHEPCIMCSYVIRHHRVGAVIWAYLQAL